MTSHARDRAPRTGSKAGAARGAPLTKGSAGLSARDGAPRRCPAARSIRGRQSEKASVRGRAWNAASRVTSVARYTRKSLPRPPSVPGCACASWPRSLKMPGYGRVALSCGNFASKRGFARLPRGTPAKARPRLGYRARPLLPVRSAPCSPNGSKDRECHVVAAAVPASPRDRGRGDMSASRTVHRSRQGSSQVIRSGRLSNRPVL